MERRRHGCDGVAAYKALLPGTYGCGEEEAGGLTLLSEAPGGSLFPPRFRRQIPRGRATLSVCVCCSAKQPSEGRGDRGGERCQLRGAQALPAVRIHGPG